MLPDFSCPAALPSALLGRQERDKLCQALPPHRPGMRSRIGVESSMDAVLLQRFGPGLHPFVLDRAVLVAAGNPQQAEPGISLSSRRESLVIR
jgi:hypothetical protein